VPPEPPARATPVRATPVQVTPALGVPALGGRARLVTVPSRALRVALANAVAATLALIWLLPAPWGSVVPLALLAQVVWFRHGLQAACTGLLVGSGAGAALGHLLGFGDWRRSAIALLVVLLPAMAVRTSARR
jgi:hypothetical protein